MLLLNCALNLVEEIILNGSRFIRNTIFWQIIQRH